MGFLRRPPPSRKQADSPWILLHHRLYSLLGCFNRRPTSPALHPLGLLSIFSKKSIGSSNNHRPRLHSQPYKLVDFRASAWFCRIEARRDLSPSDPLLSSLWLSTGEPPCRSFVSAGKNPIKRLRFSTSPSSGQVKKD
ncbi:unnamed protein product [Arabis nemorensis]|uniref:Uncharacterized protein n=1 Tax=Arabis nemorensis TaxID=586526 RepID=A0A565CN47_9BRAS|nr:unnamed protein product [Arabis nemorensis]